MKKLALIQMAAAMMAAAEPTIPNAMGGNLQDAIEQEKERKKQAKLKQPEINKAKGLKQWSEYGNVWAATRKAAIKKYNNLTK